MASWNLSEWCNRCKLNCKTKATLEELDLSSKEALQAWIAVDGKDGKDPDFSLWPNPPTVGQRCLLVKAIRELDVPVLYQGSMVPVVSSGDEVLSGAIYTTRSIQQYIQ